MSLAAPDAAGPLRRERLRTARLYFVCDARPHGDDPEPLLRAALTGGADIVQLREKELRPPAIERRRRAPSGASATPTAPCSSSTTTPTSPPLPTPTASTSARTTSPVAEAREMLGPDAIIGLSTHSEEQIDARPRDADYISVGPVWETPTKEGRPAVGLELVRYAAEHAPLPFYAIGGIDAAERRAGGRGRGRAALRRAGDPRRRRPRAPPRRSCATPSRSRRGRRPVGSRERKRAERQKRKRAQPGTRPDRTPSAMAARLCQGRGAQPRGARGAASRSTRASGRGW